MKIYVAGSWSRRFALRERVAELKKMGHVVTSRWIQKDGDLANPDSHCDDQLAAAREDLDDVLSANMVAVDAGTPSSRGGYMFEAGVAHASGKTVVVIGAPREACTFFTLLDRFDTWEEFFTTLRRRLV